MSYKFYKDQILELTVASLKSRYRKTWAGFIWVILNPLIMFGVQSLVFKNFLRLNIPNYYLFLLGGLLPWIFVSSTTQMVTPTFVTNGTLLKSFKINPLVILFSQVLDNFLNFVFTFLVILLPFYFLTSHSLLPLILIPLAVLPLLVGTLGLSVITGTLNVFFRDTNFVMGFLFSILFFLTPIFYPAELIPEDWRFLATYNPIHYLIQPFRSLLMGDGALKFLNHLVASLFVALSLSGLAIFYWKRKKNDFYNRL